MEKKCAECGSVTLPMVTTLKRIDGARLVFCSSKCYGNYLKRQPVGKYFQELIARRNTGWRVRERCQRERHFSKS